MNNYYVFHCRGRWSGTYHVIASGNSQSEAAQKALECHRSMPIDLVCVSECQTLEQAKTVKPRVQP